jgi:hypothetical protein
MKSLLLLALALAATFTIASCANPNMGTTPTGANASTHGAPTSGDPGAAGAAR